MSNTYYHKSDVRKSLETIQNSAQFFGYWFNNIKNNKSNNLSQNINIIRNILDISTASIMDVYAVSRMFKVFKVRKNEFYPTEQRNIIYYAGNGHTIPMFKFLEKIGFKMTEKSDKSILLSCVNMKNIHQPLFS